MDHTTFPPAPLPIHVSDAHRLGIGPSRLRRLDAPFQGVRLVPAGGDGPSASAVPSMEQLARSYAPRLATGQFFSHSTALALHGTPVPWPARVHVSAHRPSREPRTRGVIGHRLQLREPAYARLESGLLVEDPVRAWRQCAWEWGLDDLIIGADHLILARNRLATIEELADEVRFMGDHRGLLRRALREVREGSESARETVLRLLITRAGLPEPVLGHELFDEHGTFIARFDQCFPRLHVAVEYDGRGHALDSAQFERDADRWSAIADAGWTLVRVLNHHMRGDGRIAVQKVAAALREAGWHPGMRTE